MDTKKSINTFIILILAVAISLAILFSLAIYLFPALSGGNVKSAQEFAEKLVIAIVGIIELVRQIQERDKPHGIDVTIGDRSEIPGVVGSRAGRDIIGTKFEGAVTVIMAQAAKIVDSATNEPKALVVEAERFILKDAAGKTRAILGTTDDAALLVMLGPEGKPQTILGAADVGTLLMLDETGRPRVTMGYERSHQTGTVQLVNKNGLSTVTLSEGQLLLSSENSNSRIHLAASPENSILGIFDSKNQGYIMLAADETSKQIAAQQGKSLVAISASSDRPPALSMLDQNGRPMTKQVIAEK